MRKRAFVQLNVELHLKGQARQPHGLVVGLTSWEGHGVGLFKYGPGRSFIGEWQSKRERERKGSHQVGGRPVVKGNQPTPIHYGGFLTFFV